jgi:N-acetylglucosamine-6-phosphate deacetylase
MLAIKNVNIILRDHMIYDGVLLVDNGKIADYGESRKISIPDNARVIDGEDNYIGPGLIDMHLHAGDGVWFYEDPQKAAAANLAFGTTSLFPALYYSMTKESYIDAIIRIKKESKTVAGRIIRGIYMEGPYLNPNFGCDRVNNPWAHGIDKTEYQPVIDAVGDFAKVLCIAPELDGIEGFVKDAKKQMPDAVLSVAHSEASPDQIEAMMQYGLRLGTHHTNATGTRNVYPECRGVCVDEAVNANREIYAELICDERGIHVDPYMLRLIRKIKGDDRIILISDSCVFDGPVPEGYDGVTDINFDFAGEIAGSKLTLNKACRNMMKHTGASLCDVFRFASTNPATLLSMKGRGEIRIGHIADLVIVDAKMNVKNVILEGIPL